MTEQQELSEAATEIKEREVQEQPVKCLVWDLDNTVWDGILLEGDELKLRSGVVEILQELDRRGVLHSIASRNDRSAAMSRLSQFGIADYFVCPEIGWNAKSQSVSKIAKSLNIGMNSMAFVDDQPFEREEVAFTHPDVLTVDAQDAITILDQPRFMPRFITSESSLRRKMYQQDFVRKEAEQEFEGRNEDFLRSLGMVFTIKRAGEADLQRAEELTVRTNQLNTTGYTYSYAELELLCGSGDHLVLVSSLEDKFGSYGDIGLALVEKSADTWTVKLLLMSCRVMSRGVGTILMSFIMQLAMAAGVRLQAHFIPNGRNRMMYVTYKFGGLREVSKKGELTIFEHDRSQPPFYPAYVDVRVPL